MQNDTPKTPDTKAAKAEAAKAEAAKAEAAKAAKAAKAQAAAKAKAVQAAVTAKAAEKPKLTNAHADAGLKSRVARLVRSTRKTQILKRSKTASALTTDKRNALYDLRAFYAKPFPARGLDNGILRDLLGAGLISVSGGQHVEINGKPYIIDGENPAVITITKAGRAFGKA